MAAVLSNEISNTDKISVFVGECQRMGIEILPPDVNHSSLKFSPETVAVAAVSDRRVGDIAGEASDGQRPPATTRHTVRPGGD